MKILFLNDSSLLSYGLASGFSPMDEIRYLPVRLLDWEDCLTEMLRTWKPDFAFAEGVSISTVARNSFPFYAVMSLRSFIGPSMIPLTGVACPVLWDAGQSGSDPGERNVYRFISGRKSRSIFPFCL